MKTRRGMGNRYAVLPDGILAWYQGSSQHDAGMATVGDSIATNPVNFENYFHKLEFDTSKLTDVFYNAMASMVHPIIVRVQ